MLPKFLLADNSQDSEDIVYVVHTEKPRCIIQCGLDDFFSDQTIHWIDPKPALEKEIDKLLDLAAEFYEAELDNQDEIYND